MYLFICFVHLLTRFADLILIQGLTRGRQTGRTFLRHRKRSPRKQEAHLRRPEKAQHAGVEAGYLCEALELRQQAAQLDGVFRRSEEGTLEHVRAARRPARLFDALARRHVLPRIAALHQGMGRRGSFEYC